MSADQARIDEILVGERARKDYGDLTSLMESISEHGLLQPIGLAPGNHLLFGGRRLEACRRLGWAVIPITRPATQDDALSLLKAERDENTCRKDMTPGELIDLGMRIEALHRPAARERQAHGGPNGLNVQPRGAERSGGPDRQVADDVGEALGISRTGYLRGKHVVEASENPDLPESVRETARAAKSALDSGSATIRGAYYAVHQAREEAGAPAKKRSPLPPASAAPERAATPTTAGHDQRLAMPQPPRYGGNRPRHRQVIESLLITLAGIAPAIDEMKEFDQTITSEEAARLTSDLSRHIRTLQALNNRLKERTK